MKNKKDQAESTEHNNEQYLLYYRIKGTSKLQAKASDNKSYLGTAIKTVAQFIIR